MEGNAFSLIMQFAWKCLSIVEFSQETDGNAGVLWNSKGPLHCNGNRDWLDLLLVFRNYSHISYYNNPQSTSQCRYHETELSIIAGLEVAFVKDNIRY